MAAKKDDVTTYTKAELIKALRASVAREAKLLKRIAKLEGEIDLLKARPVVAATAVPDYDAHGEPEADEDQDLGPYDLLDPAATTPVFPWEKK